MLGDSLTSRDAWATGCFLVAAVAVAFLILRGALNGAFFSDDSFFVVDLAKNHALDWAFVAKAFDPCGELRYEVMNYAPLYALTSRIEWDLFRYNTYGYHAVNVVLHAFNATLLMVLARSAGLSLVASVFAAAFFLVHPANVEGVAWISNLRGILALACSLAAILSLRSSPVVATLLFVAGLLFKVAALFALPLAFGLAWCTRKGDPEESVSWRWIGVWCACFALYAIPQFSTWGYFGEGPATRYSNFAEHLRSMAEIGVRYMLMATTSIGVSAFQEPEPTWSWFDPWWLAAVPLSAVISWRMVSCLNRSKIEGAFWLGVAAAYAPISQITPFYFAMGDRYLYFVLPGLVVALLLWISDITRAFLGTFDKQSADWWRLLLGALALAMLASFGIRSAQRANLWTTQLPLAREGAANFPNGGLAHWLRTVDLLNRGDVSGGLLAFETVIDTGYYQYVSLFSQPEFARYHLLPEFVAVRERLARLEIEKFEAVGTPSQKQARMAATAHFYLKEYQDALRKFEAALAMDGPYGETIRGEIAVVRDRLAESSEAVNGGRPPEEER